jgi:hypothetical protein
MKVDLSEELLRCAMSAAFYSRNLVASPEAERTMLRALAAVAPLIRRAALEEAAGVVDQKAQALQYMADQIIASSGSAAAVKAASAYYVRATDASDAAAAIRALD